ncbi:hypothetical protein Csa_006931 [Cucumis sativus]|uniref:Uncharacterized protein n=1 Tax=Cucumis sativus TaxID=3659 RepID=A0A0A0M2Q9_CUCSA|nr:hypothetical protein Csa_006931 [Cucumis sativus]
MPSGGKTADEGSKSQPITIHTLHSPELYPHGRPETIYIQWPSSLLSGQRQMKL